MLQGSAEWIPMSHLLSRCQSGILKQSPVLTSP